MHLALLLSGIYLGGLCFALFDNWIRDSEPFRNEALFGAVVWPFLVVWLITLGKDRARQVSGFAPLDASPVDLPAAEPADHYDFEPPELDTPEFDHIKSIANEARSRALAEALLQIDFYRLDVESEGRPADLVELTQRIHALFALEPEVEEQRGAP